MGREGSVQSTTATLAVVQKSLESIQQGARLSRSKWRWLRKKLKQSRLVNPEILVTTSKSGDSSHGFGTTYLGGI
jgi:hypothetical protein